MKKFKLHGEAGGKIQHLKDAASEIENIQIKLTLYKPKFIFNMDEFGLFYNMKPSSSYVFEGEENDKGLVKVKSRFTGVVCCNSDGSIKIPMFIIGFLNII